MTPINVIASPVIDIPHDVDVPFISEAPNDVNVSSVISDVRAPPNSDAQHKILKCVYMNVNGLGDKLTIEDNVQSLHDNDVIVISESWVTKDTDPKKYNIAGFADPENVYRKYLHDKARRPSGGMIVYIRDAYKNVIKVIETICDHFAIIEIKQLFDFPVYIIMCYIPPEDTTYVCRTCDNNYCDTLRDLVIKYSNKGTFAVCGDLNAHTALINDDVSHCDTVTDPSDMVSSTPWGFSLPHRASCDSRVNNYGRELISLCDISGLRIMNGRCSKDNGIGKPTYIKGDTKSVIDYLLVQEKMYSSINDFSIGDKWPDSDHCPIKFSFSISMHGKENRPSCESDHVTDKYCRFYWDEDQSEEFTSCLLDETACEHLDKF